MMDRPLTDDERRKLEEVDTERPGYFYPMAGLVLPPLLKTGTRLAGGSTAAADAVGNVLLCIALILMIVSHPRASHYRRVLAPVCQDLAAKLPGVHGPIRKTYETRYQFDHFTTVHMRAYKRLRLWGGIFVGAVLALGGYASTLFLSPFIWR